ncbi:MAG: Bax inhibitor-1 family protein [Alphaproteobacteria bacterium]
MNDRILDIDYVGSNAALQAGLQKYFARIYGLVALALLVAGGVAYFTAQYAINNPAVAQFLFSGFTMWIVMFAPLILIMIMGGMVERASSSALGFMLFLIAASIGVSDSVIFLIYPAKGIYQTFFVTAGAFAALSAYGMITKRDLSAMGKVLFIGLVGLILASLGNIFFKSSGLDFAISLVGIVIFAGLIMWKTQELKVNYAHYAQNGIADKAAIMGALSLFISFINLFMFLLRFMGNRR